MVINGQRTIYSTLLQMYMIAGQPYKLLSNTTLNDKFDFHPVRYKEELPQYPTIRYIAIGVGGESNIPNMTEYSYSQHKPVDAALFNQVPFMIREIEFDLTDVEKLKYRFRRIEIINGQTYALYYLKAVPLIDVNENVLLIESVKQTDVLKVFDTNQEFVISPNPTKKSKSIEDIEEHKARYVSAVMSVKFELMTDELDAVLKYLKLKRIPVKTLTELAVCSGIDVHYGSLTEASAVQIMYHCSIDINMVIHIQENRHILRDIELGGMEPLVL